MQHGVGPRPVEHGRDLRIDDPDRADERRDHDQQPRHTEEPSKDAAHAVDEVTAREHEVTATELLHHALPHGGDGRARHEPDPQEVRRVVVPA